MTRTSAVHKSEKTRILCATFSNRIKFYSFKLQNRLIIMIHPSIKHRKVTAVDFTDSKISGDGEMK